MNPHLTFEQLQDHDDGALSEGEVRRLDLHLAACPECSEELRVLRALLGDLAALPALKPGRDLLPEIHARIDAHATLRPLAARWTLPRLAAAAVLLMVLSSTVTWWLTRTPIAGGAGEPRLAAADVRAYAQTDAEYVRAAAELEALLRMNRHELPSETVAVLERTLRVIDQALAEARAALATDPGNAMLSQLLLSNHEKKLDVLRQAAGFATL